MEQNNQYKNNDNESLNETYREIPIMTKPMKFFNRIISLFVSPIKLMENIEEYPKILHPFFVLIILAGIMAYLSQDFTSLVLTEQANVMIERYGSDIMNMNKTAEAMQGFKLITLVSVFLTQIISVAIGTTITAFFLLMISKMFKGKGKFSQFFSMWLHLDILTSLGYCIMYFIAGLLQTTLDMTSLAAVFMPQGNFTMPVYNLLTSITLFKIWQGILLAVGLKTINRFSYKKAIIISVILFVLMVIITTGLATSTVLMYDFMYETISKAR